MVSEMLNIFGVIVILAAVNLQFLQWFGCSKRFSSLKEMHFNDTQAVNFSLPFSSKYQPLLNLTAPPVISPS